jgi:demethylmenaquinone methyltransferase/2-methoxy-6-polyprenyl-1,4-benzoquinol methylase
MPMLEIAGRKADRRGFSQVEFLQANACALPFADDAFDCVTVGFGLRNVASIEAALGEMARVTRPGGKVVSLEIVGVRSSFAAIPWRLYFDVLAPRAARALQGRREAYEYLSRSVKGFASPEELAGEFASRGLRDVVCYDLALGAVCVHVGTKL